MRRILIMVIVVVILIFAISVVQAEMLSVQVRCEGCYNSDENRFWVSVGETITLIASSSGGTGSKEYKWTAENGETVLGNSLRLILTESIEYTLVVTDDIGHITKTVKIVPASPKSSCLPNFKSEITIRDEYRRSGYAAGDNFKVKVRLEDVSECPNHNIYWEADDENVVFTNLSLTSSSIETDVTIGQDVRSGDVTITVVLTDGELVRDKDVVVKVVDNSPPQISVRYNQPFSYTKFNVYFDGSTTGKNRNENNDFIRLVSVDFFDEKGSPISSVARRGYEGREIPYLSLKPNGWGIYSFKATITDSHGLTSSATKTFEVEKGNTIKDIPVIFVSDDVIYCKVGEECKIDASKTTRRDSKVSTFGYYYSNGEEIVNSNGDYCSGPVCKFIPTYPGNHKIKITAKYFGNDNIGSKIITVIVSSNKTVPTLTPTLIPTPTRVQSTCTPRYCYLPENQHTSTPETPGMGFGPAIIAMLIIAIARRIKIKY